MKVKKIIYCSLMSVSLLMCSCSYGECSKEDVLNIITENEKRELPLYKKMEYEIKVDKVRVDGDNEELVTSIKEELENLVISVNGDYGDLKLEEGESTKYTVDCNQYDVLLNRISTSAVNALENVTYSKKGDSICLYTSTDLVNNDQSKVSISAYEYYNEYNLLNKAETSIYCFAIENEKSVTLDCKLSMNITYKI